MDIAGVAIASAGTVADVSIVGNDITGVHTADVVTAEIADNNYILQLSTTYCSYEQAIAAVSYLLQILAKPYRYHLHTAAITTYYSYKIPIAAVRYIL